LKGEPQTFQEAMSESPFREMARPSPAG
jgi:hypothetical protein